MCSLYVARPICLLSFITFFFFFSKLRNFLQKILCETFTYLQFGITRVTPVGDIVGGKERAVIIIIIITMTTIIRCNGRFS